MEAYTSVMSRNSFVFARMDHNDFLAVDARGSKNVMLTRHIHNYLYYSSAKLMAVLRQLL